MRNGSDALNFIPGPTTPSYRVMKALSSPMPYHRGKEFSEIYKDIRDLLLPLFGGEGDVLVISGSSTAGVEAVISGFSSGRRVAVISDGKFGERLGDIASIYGDVSRVRTDWGQTPTVEQVDSSLSDSDYLLVVHNETSTGIEHRMDVISDLAQDRGVHLLVDVVSSIGGMKVEAERWNAKALAGGVQKCIGAPPGLAPVMIRDWDGYLSTNYYLNLIRYREAASSDQTPFTPALPLFNALREALIEVHEEGLRRRIERHEAISRMMREELLDMGFELFPKPGEIGRYSNTVTAITIEKAERIREALSTKGILVAGGQGPLRGKILRFATMANITEEDVRVLISSLREVVREVS